MCCNGPATNFGVLIDVPTIPFAEALSLSAVRRRPWRYVNPGFDFSKLITAEAPLVMSCGTSRERRHQPPSRSTAVSVSVTGLLTISCLTARCAQGEEFAHPSWPGSSAVTVFAHAINASSVVASLTARSIGKDNIECQCWLLL